MKLIHAPDHAIRLVTPPKSDTVPLSELVIADQRTGKILGGAVFEAALAWNDVVLLFLTDDIKFEDTLNIYLLDKDLNIADSARLYFAYSTGIFSHLDLTQPDTVRFRFFDGLVWTLTLHAEKKFTTPFIPAPAGVHRPFTFFRRFALSSRPREPDR